MAASDAIAAAYCGPERAALGRRYLRENIRYDWATARARGLRAYYELARKHGIVERGATPVFYSR